MLRGETTRRGVLLGATAAAATALAGCGGTGGTVNGVTTIVLWHGQNDVAKATVERLVAEFNRTHPHIRVRASSGGVLADGMLQKVMAALAAGSYPDLAYVFGSNLANLARSDKVLDLTEQARDPAFGWADRWPPARAAASVDGRVRAMPALLDSLCVVYNKKLFARSGVEPPRPGWSWADFTTAARQLTDRHRGVFGTGWPAVGDEDTVWRIWPMVWDLGGDVARHGRPAFGGTSGLRALDTVARLAADRSVYIDTQTGSDQLYQVFLGGSMAMVPTGPWQLPQVREAKLDYGVVPMPTYTGRPLTISGPDNWVIFDNGRDRAAAAVEFARWLTAPKQDVRWDASAGSLPLRRSTARQPAWRHTVAGTPGLQVFVDALTTARVRPTIRAYPQISRAVGEAIVSVLLGHATPDAALSGALAAARTALASSL